MKKVLILLALLFGTVWAEVINEPPRITSYNVCYTKLLRRKVEPALAQAAERVAGEKDEENETDLRILEVDPFKHRSSRGRS